MSTVILTPDFGTRSVSGRADTVAKPLRLTRRGKTVFLFGFLAVALVLMVVFGGLAAATREAGATDSVRVVQVHSGDTLYDIAADVAGPGEVRTMMHRISSLNELDSTSLQVGQHLAVPRA